MTEVTLLGGTTGVGRPARAGHVCGQVGSKRHVSPPLVVAAGAPKRVELTRAERYWIQRRIEKLGDAADPTELRLLEKVKID